MIPVDDGARDRPARTRRRLLAEEVALDGGPRPRAGRGRAVRRGPAALRPLGHGRLRRARRATWRARPSCSRWSARSGPASAPDRALAPGQAIQIMTGAPVPARRHRGAAGREDARPRRTAGGSRSSSRWRPARTSRRRGTEVRAGDVVLRARRAPSTPPSIAVLAAVGKARVRVGRRPQVAVLVTGDELVDVCGAPRPGPHPQQQRLAPWRPRRAGRAPTCATSGVVPDQRGPHRRGHAPRASTPTCSSSRAASRRAPSTSSRPVLARFDVGVLFTKVAIKPGAPLVFGRRGDTLVFGLPGNPVSAQVTFDLFVRAALLRMQGARVGRAPHGRGRAARAPSRNRSGRQAHLPGARALRGRAARGPARCARWARPTSWPTRGPTRSSCSRPSAPRAEAGERAPALLLGNFLERDGAPSKAADGPPRARRPSLSHLDARGRARAWSTCPPSRSPRARRWRAGASGSRPRPCGSSARGGCRKGGVVEVARLAGILAAKRTAEAIPLCHPLPLTHVDVDLSPAPRRLRDRGPGAHRRPDGRRDGGAARGGGGRPDRLRHGEGRGQGHDASARSVLVRKTGGKSGPYRRRRPPG